MVAGPAHGAAAQVVARYQGPAGDADSRRLAGRVGAGLDAAEGGPADKAVALMVDVAVPAAGSAAGSVRLSGPDAATASGREITDVRVIDDWVYFELDGWQTPGLPVEKLLRAAPDSVFRWQ